MSMTATNDNLGIRFNEEQDAGGAAMVGLHFVTNEGDGYLNLYKVISYASGCLVGKPCEEDGETHSGVHMVVRPSFVWSGRLWDDAGEAVKEASAILESQAAIDSEVLEGLREYIKEESRPIAFHRTNDVGLRLLPYVGKQHPPQAIRESAIRLLETRKIVIGMTKGTKADVETLEIAHGA
ncbi:hypothetical protein DSM25558_5111 [Agrobacterium sp. DSM 25558]|uniref:hypothetical protein n=1 Tax=Agrobacterium sp. DSM 25558 TaxID=1907665 RepID=UPI000972465B|nr:hypothetical protein [Agrobacterium sp. DSM 25558]SCX31071.1 hypothetical protein DSM25558_5111 [Agrobacterium sp. DSM 25558]